MTKKIYSDFNYSENHFNRNNHSSLKNIWPPFSQLKEFTNLGQVISASDAILYREQGIPLIDAISSWWVTLHGHSNQYIANAISTQALKLEQVIFADFSHPQAELLANRLSSITGLEKLFFSDNGSTAVEVAIKIACQYWANKQQSRKQIIAFDGAYHGDTFGAMAVGERNIFNAPFEKMLFPVERIKWPETWWSDEDVENKEKDSLDKLERLLEEPTIAVILEPLVQGAGGMRMVRPSFLKAVEEKVKEAKSLLIADEVLTGFGRCGSIFAFKKANIKPDLISLSKGLTGGFLPMGVTMATQEIFNLFVGDNPNLTFWHGHSFTANPLGCAAANASLDLLLNNPQKYENYEKRHTYFMNVLKKHSKVSKPRICGTIAAFNIKADGPSGYLNQSGKALKEFAVKNGVFIRPLGDVVYLLPPLCLTDEQLEKCYLTIINWLNSI